MSSPRRDKASKPLPDVHPELEGFDVELNRFGEVDMTIPIDRLNIFLDREVDDPKLKLKEGERGRKDTSARGEGDAEPLED